jgi:hypothetical protein
MNLMKKDDIMLSGGDSLKLIEQMIGRARAEEKDSGMGWIIWGWLLFVASLTHYFMIKSDLKYGNTVWMIFGIVAFILAMYEMVFRKYILKQPVKVKTYTNELVNRLGIAFFISLMIMVYRNYRTGINNSGVNFGYLLLLYGFWMFIHGSAFRYRLLIYGAVVNWGGAVLIFYFGTELGAETLLVHAFCVALGYLVPGHMAQRKYGQSDSLTSDIPANP